VVSAAWTVTVTQHSMWLTLQVTSGMFSGVSCVNSYSYTTLHVTYFTDYQWKVQWCQLREQLQLHNTPCDLLYRLPVESSVASAVWTVSVTQRSMWLTLQVTSGKFTGVSCVDSLSNSALHVTFFTGYQWKVQWCQLRGQLQLHNTPSDLLYRLPVESSVVSAAWTVT